jgi:hypothetical protein
VGPVGVLPGPGDWLVPEFEVPKTALGFVGELGFGGTAGLSADPGVWLVAEVEGPNTELGFVGELGLGATAAVPAVPAAGLPTEPAFGLVGPPVAPVPLPGAAAPVPVDPPDAPAAPAPPDAPPAPPPPAPPPPPPPPPPWASAIVGLAARKNATAIASVLFMSVAPGKSSFVPRSQRLPIWCVPLTSGRRAMNDRASSTWSRESHALTAHRPAKASRLRSPRRLVGL